MNIVVVESPSKAKTINKYLGPGYEVLASFGHIRDLPPKDGSVDPENDFRMLWEVDAKSNQRLNDIARALKGADKLILATDPDREGEAIAWHLAEELGASFHAMNSTMNCPVDSRGPLSAMSRLFSLIGRLNLGALITLLMIFAGLVARGADAPARAALLAVALLVLVLIATIFSSSATLARVAASHWLSPSVSMVMMNFIDGGLSGRQQVLHVRHEHVADERDLRDEQGGILGEDSLGKTTDV
jgi:hypothetical protein